LRKKKEVLLRNKNKKKMEYSGIDESNNEKNPSHFFFFKYFRFTIFGVTLLNKSLYTMIISTIIFPREFIFPVTKTIS